MCIRDSGHHLLHHRSGAVHRAGGDSHAAVQRGEHAGRRHPRDARRRLIDSSYGVRTALAQRKPFVQHKKTALPYFGRRRLFLCNRDYAVAFMQSSYCVARYAVTHMKTVRANESHGPLKRIVKDDQSTPWATMALATLTKPAALAPSIRSPSWPYSLAAARELATMFSMMDLSLLSTSSNVQERR